jgi:hypothetical protein
MPDHPAPDDETVDLDDLPPLLHAWEEFRKNVLRDAGPARLDNHMMTFMAGATVITSLIRSAASQGGSREATHAFAALCEEVDAFETVLTARVRRH